MKVVLVGIGADGRNSGPHPPVDSGGRFEYIPIPETNKDKTVEKATFGTWSLRYRDGAAADYFEYIDPGGDSDRRQRGDSLRNWPIHHDPNFVELTYGESDGRPKYLEELRKLNEDDLLAFYTGLVSEDSDYVNRYVIGYFTVDRLIDFQNLDPSEFDGKSRFGDLTSEEQTQIIEAHSENAHAKRFRATGDINEGMIIVDGKKPGGLLDRAFRISEYRLGGHRLTDELERRLKPLTSSGETNAYLGGFKHAHTLDIEPSAFREMIGGSTESYAGFE